MKKDGTLPLVRIVEEILRNAATLGSYLQKPDSQEGRYAKKRIRMGKCFVIVSSPNGYCFYPSRFMGYVDNSMEAHERMVGIKDGRDTNRAIKKVLGELIKQGTKQWDGWETEYNDFCERLGVVPSNNDNRKYWPPIEYKN